MKISDVEEFFKSYLDAEYAAAVAARTEVDGVLDEHTALLESFLHATPGSVMTPTVSRGRDWSAERLEKSALTVGDVARRDLFLVARYNHPEWHPLFAGIASGQTPLTTGSYGQLLYVTKIGGAPKIISEYFPEILEPAPPMVWSHTQGAEINGIGEPAEVCAVTAPTFDEHLEDWKEITISAV
ncbi:hypothetical protein ACFXI8_26580 [Streptomyces niveus]|uniref:hypothetical protein n=1 Tax=Streptomyces niveus TaxID=193462 RepID=UPI0036AD5F24